MVSQADRELINNFVIELRPYLETVEVGVQEFAQPNRDGVIVGQAVQALMMIRGAGQILMVDGLVSISSWLVESFEKIQNNPDIAPAEATRRLTGLYSAMDDYLTGLDRGDNVDGIVLRAKTIFEAIPSFGGPLPGTGKLRPRTDLDALFGDDEHSAQTKRMTSPETDTEKLAASASASASASADSMDQTAEIPEAMPTVPLQRSQDITQPVSEAITQPTREAPARIVPIPPQPTEELPKVDPELREIFEEEALEIIAAFGDGIRELAHNPGNREAIRSLNRAAHTLKGAANMTGFPLIAQIGAAIELLFDEQMERDQPVGRDVLELVAVSWKMLRAMVPNLNDLSSFTSPSNSIVQRANVLREELARAHADAETIPMDEAHYGAPARSSEVSEQTDQIVSLDVQPPAPQEELREVDAMMVEAAPTVPLQRDPVVPQPAVTPEQEITEPAVYEFEPAADAAATDEIVDPIMVEAEAPAEPEVDFEIVAEPATDTPFWGAPEPAVDAEVEAELNTDDDKPQSEPFWTPGTEELMRSSVGTDMLIADIQGLDDLEQEIAENEAMAEADDFFSPVDGSEADDYESAPLDDGDWLDAPERPGTDLLNFDDTPQTEPFWGSLPMPQSEPLTAPEVEEEVTMDPFFETVNPDTSFLHPISSQADAEQPEAHIDHAAEPVAEEADLVVEADVDEAVFEAAETADDDAAAGFEDDFVAGVEPFDPEQLDDFTVAPELPDDFFEEVAEEIAAAGGDYSYSYAFDFAEAPEDAPAPPEDILVEEPADTAIGEEPAEAEPFETTDDELVEVEPVEPAEEDVLIEVEPFEPAVEDGGFEADFVEVDPEPAAFDGEAGYIEDVAAQPEEVDTLLPAFDGAVAEVLAGAALEPDTVIPEPFVIEAEPVAIDAQPPIESVEVDESAWLEAEAVIPTYVFDAVAADGMTTFNAFLIDTEAPETVVPAPVEEASDVDADGVPSEDAADFVTETDETAVAEFDVEEAAAEFAEDVVVDAGDEEFAGAEDIVVEITDAPEGTEELAVDSVDEPAEAAEDVIVEADEAHDEPAAEDVIIETEAVPDAEAVELEPADDIVEVTDATDDVLDEVPASEDVVFDAGEGWETADAPEAEDVVFDDAEDFEAPEAAESVELDEVAAEAADVEVEEDVPAEPADSLPETFDDVFATMEADDALAGLDWFDQPEQLEEPEIAPDVPASDEPAPAHAENEPVQPSTGMLAESDTGTLGTSSLGFGSLDLDSFLSTEGSLALSSALLDMAFTAQPDAAGLDDGLDAPSISVFDESSERALEIEMFETFALEAEDHIATLNRATMQLDRDPLANEPLIEIKRALHTLKGASAAADFMEISDLTHELEDSLATHERLGTLPDRTFTTELFAGVEEVEAKLARRKDELFGVTEEEKSGGTLRIDVERVDDLLNTVGELVVNRSSFEERLERLEATIEDLSTAAARLQRSSYLLEREASAEDAIGRLLRGELSSLDAGMAIGDVQTDWDMLEMDRYTEFDRLIRQLAEVGADVSTAVGEIGALRGDFDTISTRQRRLTTMLQDELMGIRMVPISSLAPRLYRVVRRAAGRRGKEVSLIIEGGETPFDKLLLDTLSESLLHLLRNSVDHGIEDINERRRLAKPEQGSIRIRAFRDGSEAVIEIIDDGAGIDHEAVIHHAREHGLAVPDDITREEALLLIFEPGFTTKDEVDDISGRGLGLEIVEQTVSRYKGRVAVDSVIGRGTIFSLRLPVMLSVIQAFLVSAGEGEFAIPVANVDYVVDRVDQPLTQIGESVVIETANQIIPVVDVSARIGRSQIPVLERTSGWVMVTEIAGRRWALVVDELHGQQEIVVKPMGRFLRATPGLMGATILGHGDVALIVDVPALLGVDSLVTRLNSVSRVAEATGQDVPKTPETTTLQERPAHVVLVVDDSLSVRRVVSRTIERHGWVAVLARDGVEALELLEQGRADIVLTDIEMPRMDGFELISAIRGRSEFTELPIVVLTSRSGEKHRERALGLGANEYLVKPFQEQELVQVVEHMSRATSEV